MEHGNQINVLIGIDDTDNADSRGTGFHSRQLAHQLESTGHATVKGITRHQLYVHPAIRYTSQNSSACIEMQTDNLPLVTTLCEDYLIENNAPGSDAGLCILPEKSVNDHIIKWGITAKCEVLHMDDAIAMAREYSVYLKGFSGTHEGIIGALAATGLRAGGNDGRFIWRKGIKELREMKPGIINTQDLLHELQLDAVMTLEGESPSAHDKIYINDWVRPVLKENKSILIAEKIDTNDEHKWKLATKEVIRNIS
ncbi:MAG: hypothetical protein ABFS05_03795 [Bacteroidota bacterium]